MGTQKQDSYPFASSMKRRLTFDQFEKYQDLMARTDLDFEYFEANIALYITR